MLQSINKILLTDDVSHKTIQLQRQNNKLKLPMPLSPQQRSLTNAILLTNDQAFSSISGLKTLAVKVFDFETENDK